MTIRIVTDSTCDLPQSIVDLYKITVVPLFINIGTDSLRDGIDITRDDYYHQLPHYKNHPTTAAPAPGTLVDIYKQLFDEGATGIVSLHIAASLSAVYAAAKDAASHLPDMPIQVVDSGQISLGLGFMVRKAAQLAEAGQSLLRIVEDVVDYGKRIHLSAILDTMVYLQKSGRVPALMAGIGELLQFKPALYFHQGTVESDRLRTGRKAERWLKDKVDRFSPYTEVGLVHIVARERMAAFREKVASYLPLGDMMQVYVTPVIGTHIGPGTIGFIGVRAGAD